MATVTFSISPTPQDATVLMSSAGATQVGNTISVDEGSVVTWTVLANGYIEKSGSQNVTEDTSLDVVLDVVPSYNEEYLNYLANLLIIQYHGKPKAVATIKALAKLFPVDLLFKIRDSFDINTATGKCLDVLGKYVGVNRWYYNSDGEQIRLTDEEFRILIKFKAISNTSNASHQAIDQAFYDFFGTRVRASSDGNMEMTIFIPKVAERVIEAAIQQRSLPTPLGVEANKIVVQDKRFFGFVNYKNQFAVYKTGFRDYIEPDKEGETLNYEKVDEVERE